MINLKKINNETVKPMIIRGKGDDKPDTRPIKGANLFSELYANIFLCAKKKSGKTVVATKIIKECTNKHTTVVVFCSTLDKDKNHIIIKRYCKIQGIPYIGYTSMVEDGVNVLSELLSKLEEDARNEDESDDDEQERLDRADKKLMTLFNEENDSEVKSRKPKFQTPEYLLFFDDLSNELKSPVLTSFLKKNRHYKAKVIISSQYVHDLPPAGLKQMDYCCVFKGMPEDKLKKIYGDFDLTIPLSKLLKLYTHATIDKYSFLFIDIREESYRRRFDCKYILKDQN